MPNPIAGIVAEFFTLVAFVLILLVVLAGTSTSYPLNTLYFFEAYTQQIPGAAARTAWTLWNICALDFWGNSYTCSPPQSNYLLLPQSNFQTIQGIPWDFFFNGQRYATLSKAIFAFFMMSVVFSGLSLVIGASAICLRVGSAVSACSGCLAVLSIFLAACLMSGQFLQAKNAFTSTGLQASVNTKVFAMTWTAFACMLVGLIMFAVGAAIGGRRERKTDRKRTTVIEKYERTPAPTRRRTYR